MGGIQCVEDGIGIVGMGKLGTPMERETERDPESKIPEKKNPTKWR